MVKVKIINNYRGMRIGQIVEVGEGVAQIYEQRRIAERVTDEEQASPKANGSLPSPETRRIPGPREQRG